MAKILFIEDNLRWQIALKDILETAGHILDNADNFPIAVSKIQQSDFKVIIFDLFLGVDQKADDPFIWVDALVKGLESRKLPVPPIIIITGYPVSQLQIVQAFTEYRGVIFHFFDKADFDKRVFLKSINDAINSRNVPSRKPLLSLFVFSIMITLLLLATFSILVWGTSQFTDPLTQQTILKTGSALIIVIAIFVSVFSQGTKLENVIDSIIKAWRG